MAFLSTLLLAAGNGLADTAPAQGSADNISVATRHPFITVAVGADYFVPLPDIVITEAYVGALRPEGYVAIAAPFESLSGFDVSQATVRAYRPSDGFDISWAVLGNTQLIADPAPSRTNTPDVVFKLGAASTAYTGPAKLVISNLRATFIESVASGDIVLTIGGAEAYGSALDTLQKIDGSLGSRAARKTLKVGVAVTPFGCGGNCPSFTVAGPISAQKITVGMEPAGNDFGKQGRVFVMAIVPSSAALAGIYFMNETSAWTRFSSCDTAPSYFAGVLRRFNTTAIPLVPTPTDLSALIGTDIYTGYGIPGKVSACEDMLNNGTYSLTYVIRK